MLTKSGADVTVNDSFTGKTPLHLAVEKANIQAVRLLLEHGADVNVRDEMAGSLLS
jgi:ankyrin repeat protein